MRKLRSARKRITTPRVTDHIITSAHSISSWFWNQKSPKGSGASACRSSDASRKLASRRQPCVSRVFPITTSGTTSRKFVMRFLEMKKMTHTRKSGQNALKRYQNSKTYGGWRYFVEEAKDHKKDNVLESDAEDIAVKTSSLAIIEPTNEQTSALPADVSHDLQIGNLKYIATEQHVRNHFNDFQVFKVTMERGQAFVGLPSADEADRATLLLNNKKIPKRPVSAMSMQF
ncbi:hypothetical protein K458DRAFT_387322 [Lentithecium fluviatile CBS 122367]|uniref:RRM domain-containing protein n=1 Tax=Lentithecium fluviatile CBS 122367 TaxID=1168545 RepID=A0A6G1J6Y8_9PLEO|nr:hypothetical protein K458DRAFT_387322 [Lentithecium fluviatile CBS 122367]